jgi:hypothetical protein
MKISIVHNEQLEKEIMHIIPKKGNKTNYKRIYPAITVNLSEEATEAPGLFYLITKNLALEEHKHNRNNIHLDRDKQL